MIVDAQVHVWASDRPDRRWAVDRTTYARGVDNRSSVERDPLGSAELLLQMDAVGVDRAILVPPAFEGHRNDVALRAAQEHPDRFAVMGRLALDDPRSRTRLSTWMQQPGMLGVRLTFHWGGQRTLLADGTAEWFWPAAEAHGIPVMVYPPHALDRIRAVAVSHPGLRLVIDHFALPLEARGADIAGVVDELTTLADLDNVAVKASALPSYVREPYPFPSLHEPIRRVVEAFGAERVFWGSELSRLPCTYREALGLFTEALGFLTDDQRELVLGHAVLTWLGWQSTDAVTTTEQGAGA